MLNPKHGFAKLTWFPKFFGPEPFLQEQVGHGRVDPKIGLRQWLATRCTVVSLLSVQRVHSENGSATDPLLEVLVPKFALDLWFVYAFEKPINFVN